MYSKRIERRRTIYVTSKQKRKLIELMSKYPQLITFKSSQDFNYNDCHQLWQNIANECNAIPGAKKTWRQWRKCWQDIKSKIKKKQELNDELPNYVAKLNTSEQEALGVKNVSATTSNQDSTEFVGLDLHESFDNNDGMDNVSMNNPRSPPEEKLFTQSQKKLPRIKSSNDETKHSESCIFNCDMLTVQEQKKMQIKEDYYNFKKDYLSQKLVLLKEQTEALKNIARELAK